MFQRFSANFLSPQGFSGERFNQAVLDQVRTNHLLEALASTAVLFPNQAEDRLQRLFGPAEVQVVRWDSSKVTPPEPKPQDLESFHKANEAVFALPARRTVDVIEFLNQGATEEARRKTGEAAFAFTSQFFNLPEGKNRADFSTAAGQAKLAVRTYGPFTPSESPFPGESDPKLTAAAFALTPEDPVSDYLPSKNGYLVLHLREAQPARNRPLSEVTPEVRARWLEQARIQMAAQQAQSFTQAANTALASGQKWEDLSKVASLVPIKLPVFSPADDKPLPFKDADRIRQAVSQMEPGRVSNPIQVEDGLLAVYLVKRDPASAETTASTLPKISAQILNQRRSELIRDWITGRASLPENKLPSQVLMQIRGSL
ncbi:MAG: peptidyl-prolyl cis-trans isomerase [Verrucomicrobia bacterium]|nr:peptidyl-prolyl cis-trans isomerase [Verrucomicrobiota bacterium]